MAYDKLPALLRGLSFQERLALLVRFVKAHRRLKGMGRHAKQALLLSPYEQDRGRQHYKRPIMDDLLANAASCGKARTTADCIPYSDDEQRFLAAIEQYKTRYNRPNPTYCELLAIIRVLDGQHKDTR